MCPPQANCQIDALELWKHAFEEWSGRRRNVLGHATQIGAAAAEQQAVVRRTAEVIEDELVIGHADIARQQRGGLLGRQGAVAT
jgi:hypothetical protein